MFEEKDSSSLGVENLDRGSCDEVASVLGGEVVVLGCGNVLLGDDGFGPAVAQKLQASGAIPPWAEVIDAGTSVRELLFDITFSEQRPGLIVVIDAVDVGRTRGEVFEIPPDDIPIVKVPEYSLHQAPTSNLLRELRDRCNVNVVVIACQVGDIPSEVKMGLTPAVEDAVVRATKLVEKRFLQQEKPVRPIEAKRGEDDARSA